MQNMIIDGPCKLNGEVNLGGAKNAALPIIMAAFLSEGKVCLEGLPTKLRDVQIMLDIFRKLGAKFETNGDVVNINKTELDSFVIPVELASKIRYSLLFLGLLLAKEGRVSVGVPGGCKLGARKFDLHLDGLSKLGAQIEIFEDHIEAKVDKFKGCEIELKIATTSGTENIMIAACLAEGHTSILNAHTRPEIQDMANMLNALGAKIQVFNRRIEIDGVKSLNGGRYRIMKAWDEAVTYIAAAGITNSDIIIKNFDLASIPGDLHLLKNAGMKFFEYGNDIYVKSQKEYNPIHLLTGPFPAVNSDMQPIFAALANKMKGESTITDQRFPERFQYVDEFKKMGMDIRQFGNCAVVEGGGTLLGTDVIAQDLRCGAALAILALAAEGKTKITNIEQIQRGYEEMHNKLLTLGAIISIED